MLIGYFVCVRLFSCFISACMLYYCNTVRWAWLDWGLSGWLTTPLQCFDTVGWVIRPVKTVGRITYIVLVQTLNPALSQSQSYNSLKNAEIRPAHFDRLVTLFSYELVIKLLLRLVYTLVIKHNNPSYNSQDAGIGPVFCLFLWLLSEIWKFMIR